MALTNLLRQPLYAEAGAACHSEDVVEFVQGVAQVNTKHVCDGGLQSETDVTALDLGPRNSDLDPLCVQLALTNDVEPFMYCESEDARPADSQQLTPGLVLRAFRRIPLPEAKLLIQPPNGRTLVNFDTNFYTDQGEFTRTVTLLGRQVELRIWPETFAWKFGDGEVEETSSPGSPYPDLEITHAYRSKGRVAPSVNTTYAAQFRVGGGPWQDVAGTVTIPGSPQQLRVVTARPVLVGG